MGGGVTFVIFGYPTVKRLPVSPGFAFAFYLGIGYFLLNWWVHDHLHIIALNLVDFARTVGMSMVIDYVFHIGMMVFAGVFALVFAKTLLARSVTASAADSVAVPAKADVAEIMVP